MFAGSRMPSATVAIDADDDKRCTTPARGSGLRDLEVTEPERQLDPEASVMAEFKAVVATLSLLDGS